MSAPTLSAGGTFILYYEDSDTAGTYNVACGITSTGLDRTRNAHRAVTRDCAAPSALLVTRTGLEADFSISGSGQYELAARADLNEIFDAGVSHNWMIGVKDTFYHIAPCILTALNLSASVEGIGEISLTLEGAGALGAEVAAATFGQASTFVVA